MITIFPWHRKGVSLRFAIAGVVMTNNGSREFLSVMAAQTSNAQPRRS